MSTIHDKARNLGNNLVAMFQQFGAKNVVVQDLGNLIIVRVDQSRLWHPLTPTIASVALQLDETLLKVGAVIIACDNRSLLAHQDAIRGIVKSFFNAETSIVGALPPEIYQRIMYGTSQTRAPLKPRHA